MGRGQVVAARSMAKPWWGESWERAKVDEGESSDECEAAGRAGVGLTRLLPKLFHTINRTL